MRAPCLLLLALAGVTLPRAAAQSRLNVLLLTADDMNWDAPGCYGGKVPGITPHLDELASQGLRFTRAHVTIAVCQPSRSVLMTGRYPHRNGAEGFQPVRGNVTTLVERLRDAGYLTGILGKVRHLAPKAKFPWHLSVGVGELGQGRDPKRYGASATAFFARAREEGKPFFLMANSHDPHRPFAGSAQEKQRERRRKIPFPKASRYYKDQEVTVPGFLPDLPAVRKEVAQYYSSVHRCDETVGAVLGALAEAGLEDSTLVMFLSDNGMALPFAKTNVYLNSTKTPWIVRWPGVVKPGTVDGAHFVSGIDFMPTILDAAGLKPEPDSSLDGRPFTSVLRGESDQTRDHVLTVFHETSAKRRYEMRCLQTGRWGYLFNPWSDGKKVFRNESQAGLTFRAMRRAAAEDPEIARRVELFVHRVPEELYDFESDPNALRNLAGDPEHEETLSRLRARMLAVMETTEDPLRERLRPLTTRRR